MFDIAKQVFENEAKSILNLKKIVNSDDYNKVIDILYNSKGRVIFSGIGKSGLIANKIASTFTSIGIPSIFLHPVEALHGDLGIILKNDILIVISNSGKTKEIVELIDYLNRYKKSYNIKIISLVGNLNSTISKNSDISLSIKVKHEACPFDLIPTSSIATTLALTDAIAISLIYKKKISSDDFYKNHPGGNIGNKLIKVEHLMSKNKNILKIDETSSLKNAIQIMSKKGEHNKGYVVIINKENVLKGILTDGDLRRVMLNCNNLDLNQNITNYMIKNPKFILKDELASTALNLMQDFKITVLPVINEKNRKIIGVIHLHNILDAKVI
jgi:arabinose-5-phosphate isomerase